MRNEPLCTAVLMHNLGTIMGAIGRPHDAERLEQRALRVCTDFFALDDPALLNPLQVLAAAQLRPGKTTQAQKTFDRMLQIRVQRPLDRASVHGTRAMLLLREHRLGEAELELRRTLDMMQQCGSRETVNAATTLVYLASIYTDERRWDNAPEALRHAEEILTKAPDVIPFDPVTVLNRRAMVHARQTKWRDAENDLEQAVAAAGQEPPLPSDQLTVLYSNYAHIAKES